MIEFGRHVKRRRLALKFSLNQVAAKVGKSRAWLIDIEKGRGNPPAEAITALALALSDANRALIGPEFRQKVSARFH